MRRPGIRLLQGGLLALVALTLGLVGVSLRRPAPTPPPPALETAAPSPGTPRMGGFVFRKLDKEGSETFVLQAESMLGQEQEDIRLRGVTLTFPYKARGEPGRARIAADACVYTPSTQKAVFTGHVLVTTEDGLELATDSLIYRGDKGLARTEAPLRFKRKDISGAATGAVYDAEAGKLEFSADTLLRIEDERQPALEIRSRRALLDRGEGRLQFNQDVDAKRGADSLRSGQLVVFFGEDETIGGFSAIDAVELTTAGTSPLPGLPSVARGPGRRVLRGRRLDVSLRPDRSLEEASAGPEAQLTLLPGPSEARERRTLQARFLTFRFDEQGRLQEVQGQRDSVLLLEALPPVKAEPRRLGCRSFTAQIEPESGEVRNVDFRNDVVITHGTRKATADSAWYSGPHRALTLEQDPELLDLGDGSRLFAQRIDIDTETGDVNALRFVRHLLGRAAPGRRPGLLQKRDEEPTLVTCNVFSYEAKTKTTRYQEGAVIRSGRDEVRAPFIRAIEDKEGRRRVAALEGVGSVYHPQASPGKEPPAPVEVSAKQMVYDEAKNQVVYTGDVVMRQGDVTSKSPEATVTLTPEGSEVQTVVAGEPVEVQQGARVATGSRATYRPAAETLVVVGEKVVLKDPPQEVVGRSLTFHVGDDRILVDGQELGRTETIIKKEPPKP